MELKECSCEQGIDNTCPMHGDVSKTGFNDTVVYGIMAAIFAAGIFFTGMYVERKRSTPRPTTIMCTSNNALDGRGYFVDLTQPLFDQDCATHESFPGKILCQRMVTIECKLP